LIEKLEELKHKYEKLPRNSSKEKAVADIEEIVIYIRQREASGLDRD